MDRLDSRAGLQVLQNLGVTRWVKRSDAFFLNKPTAFAKLAILLSKPLRPQVQEQSKVLAGMLSVLGLQPREYWLGWLQPDQVTINSATFWGTIQTWKPAKLLLLGQTWPLKLGSAALKGGDASELLEQQPLELLEQQLRQSIGVGQQALSQRITLTFHPEELIEMPEKKKKAYQSLLNLKQTL